MACDLLIHVVHADAAYCRSFGRLLNAAGYKPVFYQTAQAVLDAAGSLRAGCVLLDIGMSEINGLALQSLLSALAARLPVIVITQEGDVPTAVQAIMAGAVDFL